MDGIGIGDVTALVSAVGVLVAAVAGAAVKIGSCLEALRRQTARVQATATQTRREMGTDSERIKGQVVRIEKGLTRINDAVFARANITDERINQIGYRLRSVEERMK